KNKKPPYKYEIEMIKNGTFDPDLKDKIFNQ
ncbi:deoxyribonuclease IV, partial [Mammaliicoccus sciuri]|nr:deoxyribonuclease IV [Mammaliicoccus sciuri]